MAQTLIELRQNSAQQFEHLRSITRPNLGTHKRTRLKRAGRGSSETLLNDKVAASHGKMLADDYKKRFKAMTSNEADERLRFLTVLHSTIRLDKNHVIRSIEQMEAALVDTLAGSGAWLLGAVEVEIVNIALLRKIGAKKDDEARKLNVLQKLSEPNASAESINPYDKGVLVHFHGVVDFSNSLLGDDELRKRAKRVAAWQRSPYQIELKRLFKDRTIEQNLHDIAMYLTKGGNEQLRYNAGFGRDLDEDLDAKIWRAGTGRADKGADTVPDERGLTMGEIALLDDIWRELMDRKPDKRGYLVQIG